MTAVVQRVKKADITADGTPCGEIDEGLVILVGVRDGDTAEDADILAAKTSDMRIFCDENGKMNLSVKDIGGGILSVSNFTLCADTKKGNRPSFTDAMEPSAAKELYIRYCEKLAQNGVKKVARGVFGADMKINTVLDGPVTVALETAQWRKK